MLTPASVLPFLNMQEKGKANGTSFQPIFNTFWQLQRYAICLFWQVNCVYQWLRDWFTTSSHSYTAWNAEMQKFEWQQAVDRSVVNGNQTDQIFLKWLSVTVAMTEKLHSTLDIWKHLVNTSTPVYTTKSPFKDLVLMPPGHYSLFSGNNVSLIVAKPLKTPLWTNTQYSDRQKNPKQNPHLYCL